MKTIKQFDSAVVGQFEGCLTQRRKDSKEKL